MNIEFPNIYHIALLPPIKYLSHCSLAPSICRTKVQAQRKFAQGQSAPSSSSTIAYSAAAAAAGSGSGPSTSGADSNQPPIEILPNKCPKPQDFLTFLCFRGTRALPAHLDFLNQGKSKDSKPRRREPTIITMLESPTTVERAWLATKRSADDRPKARPRRWKW